MDFRDLDIKSTLELYRSKKAKPSEVISSVLNSIKKNNGRLNAFLQLREDETMGQAKKWDEKIGSADSYPLFGIPVAIKDNFLVKGWQATAGSKVLKPYTSPYTATSVKRLEDAGAIVVGKTNCDEFAMGSSNENSGFGPARNPWDTERVPGGSSGGSAAAVAAHQALGALGTDTGGSIRQPASLCGIVGVRPTYGRVSRYGVIAYSSSLDQVGPFGKTVWDCARQLEVMGGQDPMDATSSASKVPSYTGSLAKSSLKGVSLGVSRGWLKGVEESVQKSFDDALKNLEKAGAKLVDIELPYAKYALATYYLIAPSECSSNLARYDGVHYGHRTKGSTDGDSLYSKSRGEGFGKEVKLRIMLGTYALSAGYYDAFYLKANRVRRIIQKDFEQAFQKCQSIVVPTSPTTAFKLGEKTDDPITMYLSDIFTLPVNLAGLCGVSVPNCLDSKGLPIGLQFIGKPFDEENLFQYCHAFEQLRGPFAPPKKESY